MNMGSTGTLDIGNLCIDYCKNFLNDHSCLFRSTDLGKADYYYVDDDDSPVIESKHAYTRPLRDVLPRLELCGSTLAALRRRHEQLTPSLPFDILLDVFRAVDLVQGSRSRPLWDDFDHSFKDDVYSCLLRGIGEERANDYEDDLWELLETLSPEAVLRLLAENPQNLNLSVIWRFAELVEGGWVAPEEVYQPLRPRDQYLIVTEGSTDAHILQKAFLLRRPQVADFFYFVDMKENYPFSGTGNLFNFSKGLARIRIENRVIVLYDNDAEGFAKLLATASLQLPANIRALGLPALSDFTEFPSVGPSGDAIVDINRAAASIECYLDLGWGMTERPRVRWTNYQANANSYQGALINKDAYTQAFLSLRGDEHDAYDFRKLDAVLDTIIATAVSIAAAETTC